MELNVVIVLVVVLRFLILVLPLPLVFPLFLIFLLHHLFSLTFALLLLFKSGRFCLGTFQAAENRVAGVYGNTNERYFSSIQGLICFHLRRKTGPTGEEASWVRGQRGRGVGEGF